MDSQQFDADQDPEFDADVDADADPDPTSNFDVNPNADPAFLCEFGSGPSCNLIDFLVIFKSYKILISQHETVNVNPNPHFPLMRIRMRILIFT